MTEEPTSTPSAEPPPRKPPPNPRDAIIDALMELAGEWRWEDISISDIAARAGVSLAEFRDAFPSKGAVLGGFSRRIDKIVLDGTHDDLAGEPAKERLFDVLMRRLDALAPYRLGLEAVRDWARRDPLAAAALNRSTVNSMGFMLEAARMNADGLVGAMKRQGLVLAWARVLSVWLRDDDPGLARTMAALDRELARGSTLAARLDDMDRLVSPLRALARSAFESRRRRRDRWRDRDSPEPSGDRPDWSDGPDKGSAASI